MKGLNFRYFDGNEWVDNWDTSERMKLPQAIEVTLILEGPQHENSPFYSVIPIEARREAP
jgi:hypothetical protein